MSFLVSTSFWWHVGLIFGGIALAATHIDVISIPVALIGGIAFAISGVIGVIGDLGGARTTTP